MNLDRLRTTLVRAHELCPAGFETLPGSAGVGPATVRSLALIAEVIHDAPVSRRDPAGPQQRRWADYSYAHGGKDGFPFPVDRQTYDRNVHLLLDAVRSARIGETDRTDALRKLGRLFPETAPLHWRP